MKWLNSIFFYGYVFLLIVAGAWGACFAAQFDHNVLFNLDVQTLVPKTAASLLSQYRFLRAIEFGFGIFAVLFRKEIFSNPKFNRVFLATMLLGVVARIISFILDGQPNAVFYFFAISELTGVIIIYIYSRRTLEIS